MEKRFGKEKQVSSEERRRRRSKSGINDLPDPLLCHILSFLPTKDSVRSSLLSKRWRNIWLQVPVFDLDSVQFDNDVSSFMEFVDRFLESDKKLALDRFKLMCSYEDLDDDSVLKSWIDALVRRRVRHLDFQVNSDDNELVWMPLSLYSCNTLVSLSLYHVALCGFELASAVSLPCLKLASCPVLEKLTVIRDPFELLEIMRVRSKSLKTLTLGIEDDQDCLLGDDHVVEIDAPRLEHMSLCDHLSGSIIIHSIAPYASVNIDVNFEGKDGYALDLDDDDDDSNSKRTMIRNILTRIFTVSRMEISSVTLQVINDYSKLEMLPQFSNLSWDLSLIKRNAQSNSSVPPCFVSSLKYVELATQGTTRPSSQMKLAIYFLRNCAALKKLTLSGSFGYDIIKKIKKIPRRSRRCIIVTG
uniref:F-box domain-containing protein n=1 Tax=Brassica oleracea var. oleracea TaxID=109376 RepID=A0A0D3CXC0_BRAOL